MRWRLLLIVSLLATIVGAGSTLGLVYFLTRPPEQLARPTLLTLGTLLIPVLVAIFAGIFVYRHTARRRRLQAMLTVLFISLLTLAILSLSSVLYTKPAPAPTPAPAPRNSG